MQHGVIEMQAGGRCRHGPGFAGKHGLVTFLVVLSGYVADVRRQGQVAVAIDQLDGRCRAQYFQQKQVILSFDNLSLKGIGDA